MRTKLTVKEKYERKIQRQIRKMAFTVVRLLAQKDNCSIAVYMDDKDIEKIVQNIMKNKVWASP